MSKSAKVILSVILYAIDFVITGFVTIYIWNNIICQMFPLRTFTFWQGYAFALATTYFIPHKNDVEEKKDWIKYILSDVIYTLFIWLLSYLAVKFIAF